MLGCLVWSVADGGDDGACAKAAENIRPLSAVLIMSFFIIENLLWWWIDGWGSSRRTEIVPLEENARGGRAFLALSGSKVSCFSRDSPLLAQKGARYRPRAARAAGKPVDPETRRVYGENVGAIITQRAEGYDNGISAYHSALGAITRIASPCRFAFPVRGSSSSSNTSSKSSMAPLLRLRRHLVESFQPLPCNWFFQMRFPWGR